MKCNCCDRDLSDTEIVFNDEIGTFEMCSTCLNVALEAAYSQGFNPDESLDDPEMEAEHGNGAVETIDPDFQRDDQFGDSTDIQYFGGYDEDV